MRKPRLTKLEKVMLQAMVDSFFGSAILDSYTDKEGNALEKAVVKMFDYFDI